MQQTTAEQPKTRHLSHKFTPVFATQKLAGFAEFTQICGTTPTRNRDTRYRYIGDEPLVLLENAGSAGGNTGANASTSANGAKTRSRPNSEYVLYSNGEPVAVNADGDTSYFGTDILGSVRSVTDKYGQVTADYSYDAFGTPYLSNDFDSGAGFGYTGKVYDSATGLYDYGFRDYAPNSARFTTVDPVRDGANWFSYVVNDPVNYIDPFGLTSNDICYTVQPGDCVWKIADKYDCTTQQVIDNNNFSNPNLIHPGDKIYIPVATPATATDTGSAISVATPSNNGSNNVSTNTTNGGSFGSAPIGGGAGQSAGAGIFSQIVNGVKNAVSEVKNSAINAAAKSLKSGIKENSDPRIINDSSFVFIGIPDDDSSDVTVENIIIRSGEVSVFSPDSVYDPKTGKIKKATDGYSIIITDKKNRDGSIEPDIKLRNDVNGKTYRVKAFIGHLQKSEYNINDPNCPSAIKSWVGPDECGGKVIQAIDLYYQEGY